MLYYGSLKYFIMCSYRKTSDSATYTGVHCSQILKQVYLCEQTTAYCQVRCGASYSTFNSPLLQNSRQRHIRQGKFDPIHTMRAEEKLESQLNSFLTSALAECKWSYFMTQPPCRGGRGTSNNCKGKSVDHTTDLNNLQKRKISYPCRESNHVFSVVQPVELTPYRRRCFGSMIHSIYILLRLYTSLSMPQIQFSKTQV